MSNPTTHGGLRPGAGRPPLDDDPANPTERHTITLPANVWRRIEALGEGNRSAGIRTLIDILRYHEPQI